MDVIWTKKYAAELSRYLKDQFYDVNCSVHTIIIINVLLKLQSENIFIYELFFLKLKFKNILGHNFTIEEIIIIIKKFTNQKNQP